MKWPRPKRIRPRLTIWVSWKQSWRSSSVKSWHLLAGVVVVEVSLCVLWTQWDANRPYYIVGFDVAKTGVARIGFVGKKSNSHLCVVMYLTQYFYMNGVYSYRFPLCRQVYSHVEAYRNTLRSWCIRIHNSYYCPWCCAIQGCQASGNRIKLWVTGYHAHFYHFIDSWSSRYHWRCKGW
jgi:hypothetical protein